MKNSSEIKMTFRCNQNWETMRDSAEGKYCGRCEKSVFDFSTLSRDEILQKLQNHKSLCGRFTMEQVDNNILKIIEPPRTFRSYFLISLIGYFTSIKTGDAAPSIKPLVEQTAFMNSEPLIPIIPDTTRTESPAPKISENRKPFLQTKKRYFYWYRKFPFIKVVRKRRYIIGALI